MSQLQVQREDGNQLSLFATTPDLAALVGEIVGEYDCTFEKSNGTLYAGSRGVYFVGSFFLFERKLILYWDQIRLVEKLAVPGVGILCKDASSYHFSGYQSSDRFWSLLLSLHNDALLDRRGDERVTMMTRSHSKTSFRRRNSDPWKNNPSLNAELSDDSANDDDSCPNKGNGTPEPLQKTSAPFAPKLSEQQLDDLTGKQEVGPISCRHKSLHGNLYAGEKALVFVGKQFFWEQKTLTIPWDSIVKLKILENDKESNSSNNNNTTTTNAHLEGIQVLVKGDNRYLFTSVVGAPTVWASLISLQNGKLTKAHAPPRQLRRMNSDPLQTNNNPMFDLNDDTVTADTEPATPPRAPAMPMEERWKKVQAEGSMEFVVVRDHVLPCNLDRFYDLFLTDGADFSIAKFLQGRGDSALKTNIWTPVDEVESNRVINYTHPVNAPLAPPQADASKDQVCRRFGSMGLVVETKTFVRDVPMTDCFYVADRLVVEPVDEESVSVKMEFDITFVKSTMFKGIISQTTKSELTSYLNDFASYMSKALGEAPPKPVTIVAETKDKATSSPIEFDVNKLVLVLLLVVLVVQVWILLELRGMKTSVRLLEARQVPTL